MANRGFSIVELMVVVGIALLLVNTSISAYRVAQHKAITAEAKTNTKIMKAYADEYILTNRMQLHMPVPATYSQVSVGPDSCPFNASNHALLPIMENPLSVDCSQIRLHYFMRVSNGPSYSIRASWGYMSSKGLSTAIGRPPFPVANCSNNNAITRVQISDSETGIGVTRGEIEVTDDLLTLCN